VTNRGPHFYNRRTFIKVSGYAIISFFMLIWYQLIKKHFETTGGKDFQKISLAGKANGIYFFDSFLVVKKGASFNVLSNRCTHAGCKVNKEHDGNILCACHGSTYSHTGKVMKGPATKPLSQLSYTVSPVTGEITVKLNS